MDVKLIVQSASHSGQVMRLRNTEMTVGRQRGCGVRIPSGQVSRQHCLLTYNHDVLAVEDLSSANGTYINGRRIAKREFLRPGDKLTVGPITMLVQYQLSETGVQHLLGTGEQEFVAVPLDDVQVLAGSGGADAGIQVIMEDDTDAPLAVDDALDEPAQDPLDALRAIEAKATAAPAPKKAARTPRPKKAPAPAADDLETMPTTPPMPPPRVKVAPAERPLAPAAALDDDFGSDEPAPDASQILGQKNWQLPTGEDIRDILAQIEKGKKK